MEEKESPKKENQDREETPPGNSEESEEKDLDSARGGMVWRSVYK